MLTDIHPKLPMRDKEITLLFYLKLGFEVFGNSDYEGYLMMRKDEIQLHFFAHPQIDIKENYGQVYIRTDDIMMLYQEIKAKGVSIHPQGPLELKPWGQWEFALLDPDMNLLTFGQEMA